jgi:hypothetical protein
MRRIIHNAQQFTPAIANEVLVGRYSAPITSVDVQPLGEGVGLLSSIGRATLGFGSLDLDKEKSTTVIIKVVSQNENIEIAKGLNFYLNEVNFYRDLASGCPIKSPECLYAEIDPETQEFLLILEDFGNEVAGDQLKGCESEVLTLAFENAAKMHAHFWERVDGIPWLSYHDDEELTLFRRDAIYKPSFQPTLNGFGELFHGNLERTVARIGEQFAELSAAAMSGPQTLTHGDYRIDNMLLPVREGQLEMIAVDWQNTRGGNCTHDIAYFSAQSCGPELRGETELASLRHYHDVLIANGVKNYTFDECLTHYRLNLMLTMITPIAVCGTLDSGNARGEELGKIMLSRSLAALESMECDQLLN